MDAVTVKASKGLPDMDGVIAYLDNNNNNKIGVRLTGSSVGLGDHSGSVDGINYFDCPLNSGLFVTRDEIEIRQLSRIEELKLKRELAAEKLDLSRTTGITTSHKNPVPPPPPPKPEEPPLSDATKGLSATALTRLQKLNQKYMQETIGQSSSKDEDDEEEMLLSDMEDNNSIGDENEEKKEQQQQEEENIDDDSQLDREMVNRMRQERKEEIQRRKEELRRSKNKNNSNKPDNAPQDNERFINRLQRERKEELERRKEILRQTNYSKRKEQNDEPAPVERVPWPEDNDPPPLVHSSSSTSIQEATRQQEEQAPRLSRLEQLKLKKRQLEHGTTDEEEESAKKKTTTAMNGHSMSNGVSNQQQQAPVPAKDEMAVQIINSSSKRMKEVTVEISPDINLFDAVYDHPLVKQANVRKWASPYVQQVRAKTSQISCQVSLGEQEMELSIDQLKETSTLELYRLFENEFTTDVSLSKIQMLLVCQPVADDSTASLAPPPRSKQESTPSPRPPKQGGSPMAVESPQPPSRTSSQSYPPPSPASNGRQVQPPPAIIRSQEQAPPSTNMKHQLHVKIINDSTNYFKDLMVEVTDQMNLYESIYNHPGVKQARVRKWDSTTVDRVHHHVAEIVCQVCTVPDGQPDQLVQHPNGILTVEELRQTTTKDLYSNYVIGHHDLNDKPLVQLILKCRQCTTPQASNNTNSNNNAAAVSPLASPEAKTSQMMDLHGREEELHDLVHNQSSISQNSSTSETQRTLSFNSLDRKDTAQPYAKAASAALPIHGTQTKFSDLMGTNKPPRMQPVVQEEPEDEEDPETYEDDGEQDDAENVYDSMEKGYQPSPVRPTPAPVQESYQSSPVKVTPAPVQRNFQSSPPPRTTQTFFQPPPPARKTATADAQVQTAVVATPTNRRPSQQQQQQQQRPQDETCNQKLQQVDAFWWIACICILSAAFFAALFLGPV
eukprot:scaffold2212_cov143-Cylindrotheca_fusiformis.AAC.10